MGSFYHNYHQDGMWGFRSTGTMCFCVCLVLIVLFIVLGYLKYMKRWVVVVPCQISVALFHVVLCLIPGRNVKRDKCARH